MRSFSLLVVLAVILVAFMTKPSQSQQIIIAACTTTVGTYNYNLTALAQQYLTQDATTVDAGNNVYYYRPCQVLLNQQCVDGIANPAACQRDVRRPPEYHNCGTVPSASFKQRATAGADQGFLLTFTGGSDDRQLDIEFVCDKGAGAGQLVAKNPAEAPPKSYHLQWASSFACPVQSGGDGGDGGGDGHNGDGKGDGKKGGDGDDGPAISGGWIFIICLVGVTILYFAVGAVVNKFVRHKEGIEIIPNVEFWMALPGLVKDGHLFVYKKLRGLCGRGGFEEV